MVLVNVRFCPRRHPIDSDRPCQLCAQEDKQRDEEDDKLLEALKRLAASGKLASIVVEASGK